MKTVVDARLRAEAERFHLRFACEDCAQFDEERGCAHGYPLAPHRADLDGDTIVFCKEFETA
ncbi:MAG TPA: hypothetical protein VF407_15235 [Polyangiaceae bacterium]